MYKYEMIAEEIQKKIKDGTYPPDTRLPQEMEMCKIYDASRITIREAMGVSGRKWFDHNTTGCRNLCKSRGSGHDGPGGLFKIRSVQWI